MATCHLCSERVPDEDVLEHLRLFHPGAYGTGPETWPDGGWVIEDRSYETPADTEAR